MTLRDEAWNAALDQLARTGKFKISDLPFKESERHTVRRCLREMQAYGWVKRDDKHSKIWRVGPKAELLMNISEEKLEWSRD